MFFPLSLVITGAATGAPGQSGRSYALHPEGDSNSEPFLTVAVMVAPETRAGLTLADQLESASTVVVPIKTPSLYTRIVLPTASSALPVTVVAPALRLSVFIEGQIDTTGHGVPLT